MQLQILNRAPRYYGGASYRANVERAMREDGLRGGSVIDNEFEFGLPDITNSTTKTVSPYVFDAGAAELIFGGRHNLWLSWKTVITADAAPTIHIEMWAGDAADGDVNDNETLRNEILGASGIVRLDVTGAVLASGAVAAGSFPIGSQTIARRYYGLNVTLGGTNPDIVAATSFAYVTRDAPSNMLKARDAVPA